MKTFETNFLDLCYGKDLANFLEKIHKNHYQWRMVEIDYMPFGEPIDEGVTDLAAKINENEQHYYDISAEDMLDFLSRIFQIVDFYVEVIDKYSKETIFIFEVVDGDIFSLNYKDPCLLDEVKNAAQGWIDIDHPILYNTERP